MTSSPARYPRRALLDRAIARFKTPGLRDLSHSAPYMHTGQFDTLDDIIGFYRGVSAQARAGITAKRSVRTSGHRAHSRRTDVAGRISEITERGLPIGKIERE